MNLRISRPVDERFAISFEYGEAPAWYVKVMGGPHNGLDFACPIGTPVLACDEGKVTFADDIPDSDGKGLILSHEWGISLYWHLNSIIATLGNVAEKGAPIS